MNLRHTLTYSASAATFLSVVAGASGAAIAAATVAGADAPNTPCPGNVTQDVVVQGCLPSTQPPADNLDLRGPDEVPTLNGIPCTGSNTDTCIGLSRLPSADAPEPDTTVKQNP